jgi:hypothetical protein
MDERGVAPSLHEARADTRDGGAINVEGVGNRGVLPCRTIGCFVRFEEDAGVGDLARGSDASGDETVQGGTIIVGEENTVDSLTHCAPPAGKDAAPIGDIRTLPSGSQCRKVGVSGY